MRAFRWCEQKVAEDCWWDEEHVHICITTPGYRKITPRCGRKTLNLFFADLEPEEIRKLRLYTEDPVKGELRVAECFTESQALAILTFVNEVPEEFTIIINCEGGISRSPALVLAFRKHFGGDTQEVHEKAYPNSHVLSVMSKILEGP